MNTEVRYCYRDSGNNRIWRTAVFVGAIPNNEVFHDCCHDFDTGDRNWFLPNQVCADLPSVLEILGDQGYTYDEEIDGPWLWLESVEPTNEKATVKMGITELLRKFQEAKGKWDEAKARELLGI